MTVSTNGAPAPSPSTEVQIPDSGLEQSQELRPLDASKLVIRYTDNPQPLPQLQGLVFGANMTDHMLIASFDPSIGWSTPVIKPYGPLTLDPACSVFQYCPVVFEGMKAYMDPDGHPRLFRPELNMKRLARSTERAALPAFDPDALLTLIKRLVEVDKRWIPERRGYSLYIRPTIIGTRPALGVAASTHSLLYVILSPAGPYFPSGIKPISILASVDCQTPSTALNPLGDPPARSWPGGTGEFKLGINYAPTFDPQRQAAKRGYDQVLWVLDEPHTDRRITEMGQMNFFVVVKRADGDVDLITPYLDGTILSGVTRASILALASTHSFDSPLHPSLAECYPSLTKIHTVERKVLMSEITSWINNGELLEVFGAATAAVITPIGRIGYEGKDWVVPQYEAGLGPIANALFETITDIQQGVLPKHEWSVLCAE